MPEMMVRCAGGALRVACGVSSTILPAEGTLTSRLPSGVHVSRRASATSAHASAFQPRGSVTVCGPWKEPWRLAAGTLIVTRALPFLAEAEAPAGCAAVFAAWGAVGLSCVPPQPADDRSDDGDQRQRGRLGRAPP